ncbi:MAG: hypothetical protein ACTSQE_13425 [Candidatus Heimdallarchaeaceae archaeon]
MSLTSFLKIREVKEKFREEFKKPRIKVDKELRAPPQSKRYGLVGTAFDYLMRFVLEYHNPKAQTYPWVAEIVPKLFQKHKKAHKMFKIIIKTAKMHHKNYLKTGEIRNELLDTCIVLAQMDIIYRASIIDQNFGQVYETDIQDLRNLVKLIPIENFRAKDHCFLNPTFGEGSILVGGADADIIIDGALIDIKTTKKLEFKREYFDQLIGYYTLKQIGGIDRAKKDIQIKELGVYYSRYGEIIKFPVEEVIDEERFDSFAEWFKETAAKYFEA